jgi:hypothetical protein
MAAILRMVPLFLLGALMSSSAGAGTGWIPPRTVTAVLPGATLAPGSVHTLDMTIRANGVPASLDWTVTAGGQFPLGVSPSTGSIDIAADNIGRVTFTVTAPPETAWVATISVELKDQLTHRHVAKVSAAYIAASGGRAEVWPAPSSWAAPANTAGALTFQVHSIVAAAESVDVTMDRSNPDPNNAGALFSGSNPPATIFLPGNATVTLTVPTTIAGSAYGGNANTVSCTVSSNGGNSFASAHAVASAAIPDSLPTTLVPIGLVPTAEAMAGRDGPVELPWRGLWLVPAGLEGVRVIRSDPSLAAIGPIDTIASGTDDRLVGRIRIPSFAASLAVVPGFIGPAGDTLDLGLLAAGRAGLMLLDLRQVLDYPFGTWEDFFDTDMNGIDDRILRTIPLSGFATDVAWFRAPSGRIVALVAEADTGSVPVSASYNPAAVVAGTGAGVVAIDVTAAYDSLGGVPYAAGTLATPGSTLDLELRRAGSGAPDLAIADGASGVSMYRLTAGTGAPATITYTLLGSVALSSAWGTPYARDLCWIPNTRDSVYLAVGASAGGTQIVRAPLGGAPSLVLSQQTSAGSIGLGATWTGNLGVALGQGGVALMRIPGAGELDRIAPAAAPPYAAPVQLARGQIWTEGRPLELALHKTPSSAASSMAFGSTEGPIPDLLVSDGARELLLRPGQVTITGVAENRTPPRAVPLHVSVAPNPLGERTEIRVFDSSAQLTSAGLDAMVFDVQGRLVRRIRIGGATSAAGGAAGSPDAVGRGSVSASLARFRWDGRDDRGRRLGSGRYWLRVKQGERSATLPILILR